MIGLPVTPEKGYTAFRKGTQEAQNEKDQPPQTRRGLASAGQ